MATGRDHVLSLIAERDTLENEINQLRATLQEQGVGMQGPLLTPDGFPRNDIDIPAIRNSRVRVIRLENDVRGLMDQIAEGLHEVFSPSGTAQPERSTATGAEPLKPNGQATVNVPFARVESVEPESPAASAGLRTGDRLTRFGGVSAASSHPLRSLAGELSQSTIVVSVRRDEGDVGLRLDAAIGWSVGSRLGCRIVPL